MCFYKPAVCFYKSAGDCPLPPRRTLLIRWNQARRVGGHSCSCHPGAAPGTGRTAKKWSLLVRRHHRREGRRLSSLRLLRRPVKHLSRVLVPSTHVEDGGFDQSLQLPAMATRWASFLSNGASLRASKMFCSTRSHRRHAPFFRRFHPAETKPPKRARSFSTSSHTEGNVLSPRGPASAGYVPSQSLPGLSQPLR